jgi:hypothetical protein
MALTPQEPRASIQPACAGTCLRADTHRQTADREPEWKKDPLMKIHRSLLWGFNLELFTLPSDSNFLQGC